MGAGQEQGVARVCSSSSDEETSQHLHMANGALETRSLATWSAWPACARDGGACHDCTVEPERRQVGPAKPAVRRTGASCWAHRKARKEREQSSLSPLTRGAAVTDQTRERRVRPRGAKARHLTAMPVASRLRWARSIHEGPARAWARECANESDSACVRKTTQELAPCIREKSGRRGTRHLWPNPPDETCLIAPRLVPQNMNPAHCPADWQPHKSNSRVEKVLWTKTTNPSGWPCQHIVHFPCSFSKCVSSIS